MKYICPFCGNELLHLRMFHAHYSRLYRCSHESIRNFLEVVGTLHSYPLQNLENGVAEILMEASEEIIDKAFSRIKYIDYKTISIIYFEQTLLGIYQNKEYQIVRPD
jgi:hypothetical protein